MTSPRFIEAAIGLPVVLENAANACALAELWFGRHPEHIRHLLAVTVSEGIGVGLLVNGQLLHGGHAMAGEFGHVTIDEHGPPCPCGKRGCWERYASNSAAVQHYVHGPSSAVVDIPRFEDLLRFADQGDRRAEQALERMARYLGFGLAGLATGLAPEVIVIIGEMTAAWDRLGPIVLDEVKKRTLPHVDDPHRADRSVDPAAAPRRGHAGRAAALRRAERRVSGSRVVERSRQVLPNLAARPHHCVCRRPARKQSAG